MKFLCWLLGHEFYPVVGKECCRITDGDKTVGYASQIRCAECGRREDVVHWFDMEDGK